MASILFNCLLFVLLCGVVFVSAQTGCTGTVDGKNYDLTSLTNDKEDWSVALDRPTNPFKVNANFCRPLVQLKQGTATCTPASSSACQYWDTPTPAHQQSVGLNSTLSVTTLTGAEGWQVTYTNGQFSTVHQIACDSSVAVGTPSMGPFPQGSKTFTFIWKNQVGCTAPVNNGGGKKAKITGGDVILILFFCGGFVYLAAGFAIQRFARHMTGWDQVPNKDFWVGFGGLIKDGGRFITLKTCRRGQGYTQV